jgi:hypothetical protein
MKVHTNVSGYIPPDEKWKKMKEAWDSCKRANVSVPDEVVDFFDGEYPENKPGMEVDIEEAVTKLEGCGYCTFSVDVKKLPPNVTQIHLETSW